MNFQISGRWTALTSIQLITKSGASSLPEKAQDMNDHLRQHLIDVWVGVKQSVIDDASNLWRRRLHAYIWATRGHFEYSPWHKLRKTLFIKLKFIVKQDIYFISSVVSWYLYRSQGSVAMRLKCGGIFNNVSLCVYCRVRWWKNFENRSTFS